MSWTLRTILGLALALSANAALAGCPNPCGYDRGYSLPTYGDVAQHYGGSPCDRGCGQWGPPRYEPPPCSRCGGYDDGYWEQPPPCRSQACGCRCGGGEVSVPPTFFHDNGGFGPIPQGGYGGGGGYVMSGGGGGGGFGGGGGGGSASASAYASASASSSSHISINVGGGGRGGHGGGGGCSTCGHGH